MSWRDGYVTDVPYTRGVYLETAPTHLSTCALLNGVEAPDPLKPYRYLDLGCGAGVGVCLLAAANPHAEFVGVDFNPAHVAAGRRLIAVAGLENAAIVEASFHDVAESDGLGRFDYAVAHGIWTWVSPAVQADLVRALDRSLQPGALAYLGYNNMAGWASTVPMQRLLVEHAARVPGDSLTKIRAAMRFALGLRSADAWGIEFDRLEALLERGGGDIDRMPIGLLSYMAHEYLNEHWRPVFPTDLEASLAGAKLSFVATADPCTAVPELVSTAAQREAMAVYADAASARRLGQALAPASFRQDVFCRGPIPLSPAAREERLRALRVRLITPPSRLSMTLTLPRAKLELDEAAYRPVLDRLGEGPAGVGELLDRVRAAGGSMGAVELLAVALGAGWAAVDTEDPGSSADPTRATRTRRYNAAMIASMRDQPATRMGLASPALGGGVAARPLQIAALLHLWGIHSPTEAEREEVEGAAAEWGDTWRALGIA